MQTLPQPIGYYTLSLGYIDSEQSFFPFDGGLSVVLGELWFARRREARAAFSFPEISMGLQYLPDASEAFFPACVTQDVVVSCGRDVLLADCERLCTNLQESVELPKRFAFGPLLPAETPVPLYSSRKMRTGSMIAGIDLCMINRNWDGTDRVEDLRLRDTFTDAVGDIRIVSRTLWEHFGDDLSSWMGLLQAAPEGTIAIQVSRSDNESETYLTQVMERAERWRERWGVAGYEKQHLAIVDAQWKQIIAKKRANVENALDLAAYVSELMRAQLGGFYETSSAVVEDWPKKQSAIPAIQLRFPFDCQLQPFAKVARSLLAKRGINWSLQLDVFAAQKRQRGLFLGLTSALFQKDLSRQTAALQILLEIPDGRVDRILSSWLQRCEHDEQLLLVLDRLYQARFPVPRGVLSSLLGHPRDGVVARALWLLHRYGVEEMPEVLLSLLAGGKRMSLRPLARYFLETMMRKRKDKARIRKVLKSLGPIPPHRSEAQLFPDPPKPLETMPLMAEILEDCANPARREAALAILALYPDRDEATVFGEALADPEPALRQATIGLLAESDRTMAIQLLKGRLLFEQDPACRVDMQKAIEKWSG